MRAWGRSFLAILVALILLAAMGASAVAGTQATPHIQVGASSSLTAVELWGDTLRDDPDVRANRPDGDGLTHVSSNAWLTVASTITAPYSGTFAVCTYPWATTDFSDDQYCSEGVYYGAGQQWSSAADVYLDPAYSGGQYRFYVYLWEWTGNEYEAVDWVWFTVAVDREPAQTTPRVDDTTPASTPEVGTPGGGTPADDGDGDGTDGGATVGGDDGQANVGSGDGNAGEGTDRGDLLSPRNVALMMLFIAAASLFVQLLRGP